MIAANSMTIITGLLDLLSLPEKITNAEIVRKALVWADSHDNMSMIERYIRECSAEKEISIVSEGKKLYAVWNTDIFQKQKYSDYTYDILKLIFLHEFGHIDQSTASGQGLVFGSGQYYINLPKSVLMVIALILDITLTKGIISGVCGVLGVQTQAFYHINQHKGEACLLRECLRNDNAANSDGYSYLTGKECINNDLECQYRNDDGQCCIQKTDIEEVLTHFKEAHIIKR